MLMVKVMTKVRATMRMKVFMRAQVVAHSATPLWAGRGSYLKDSLKCLLQSSTITVDLT